MLTARADAPSVLAALDLLPHTVRTAPRDVRTLLSGPTPDAVMVLRHVGEREKGGEGAHEDALLGQGEAGKQARERGSRLLASGSRQRLPLAER